DRACPAEVYAVRLETSAQTQKPGPRADRLTSTSARLRRDVSASLPGQETCCLNRAPISNPTPPISSACRK
ncbi:MAG TPA: hypothetical protein PKZ89_02600, partial [Alphaproteobacteria bacterium]|nr:hypothetical protein [Alphaproteobacteria bacterium]